MKTDQPVIVGGGLTGSLLALVLARHGERPIVLEQSKHFSAANADGGRSINLAMAARGMAALAAVDALDRVTPLLLPMEGRLTHDVDGSTQFHRYGQRPDEKIYSISREGLNQALFQQASALGIEYRFNVRVLDMDPGARRLTLRAGRKEKTLTFERVFAADGAGSAVRRRLAELGHIANREELLDHGYKELTIPPRADGFAIEPRALHIWPRGDHMLIALPNQDQSFTATLFLAQEGTPSFATLKQADQVARFLTQEFPDAVEVMRDPEQEFLANPTGIMGTVYAKPWSYGDRVLLVGDAAHAVVPFHGQGMNAAFEDCAEMDRLLEQFGPDWPVVFERFEARRIENTNAIARMAIENYLEMRDTVRDPAFALKKSVAFELEQRFPERFIPQYSMVMFHAEIPYARAERQGTIQSAILDELTEGIDALEAVDFDLARRLIEERL